MLYVNDWKPCANCGTTRPPRELVTSRPELPPVCRDAKWCAEQMARVQTSGPKEDSGP
jgi:hypothetical protein